MSVVTAGSLIVETPINLVSGLIRLSLIKDNNQGSCCDCDNAANMMVLMAELLEGWGDLSCFGHTLQPAVTAGVALHTIARLAAVCHKIAGHFKQCCGHGYTDREEEVTERHSLLRGVATW